MCGMAQLRWPGKRTMVLRPECAREALVLETLFQLNKRLDQWLCCKKEGSKLETSMRQVGLISKVQIFAMHIGWVVGKL